MIFVWFAIQSILWIGSGTVLVMTDHLAWATLCYIMGIVSQIPRGH